MNTTISDINGDIYITLKSVATDKWLSAEEIVKLLKKVYNYFVK